MAKPRPKPVSSPFDALIQARQESADHSPVQTSNQSDSITSRQLDGKLAKSTDPAYLKFTTYIRKQTHRSVKLAVLQQEREMSDLVEELLSEWLQTQQQSNN